MVLCQDLNHLSTDLYYKGKSHLQRCLYGITKLHVTVKEQSWKRAFQRSTTNYQFLVITQVIIREATIFTQATIIREATFLEVHVYIKANYPIAKLQFALPQTILK